MAKIVDLARTLAGHDRELESDLIADLIMEADLTGPELDAIQQRLQRNAHAARQRARRQRRTPNMSSLNTLGDEDDHDSPVEAISHDSPDRDAMLHELETEIFSIPSTPFEREYLAVLFGKTWRLALDQNSLRQPLRRRSHQHTGRQAASIPKSVAFSKHTEFTNQK
jgi:hypothetical protein